MEFLCELTEVAALVKEFYDMEIVEFEYLEGYEDLNIRLHARSQYNVDIQEVVLKLSPLINPKVASSVGEQIVIIVLFKLFTRQFRVETVAGKVNLENSAVKTDGN